MTYADPDGAGYANFDEVLQDNQVQASLPQTPPEEQESPTTPMEDVTVVSAHVCPNTTAALRSQEKREVVPSTPEGDSTQERRVVVPGTPIGGNTKERRAGTEVQGV